MVRVYPPFIEPLLTCADHSYQERSPIAKLMALSQLCLRDNLCIHSFVGLLLLLVLCHQFRHISDLRYSSASETSS